MANINRVTITGNPDALIPEPRVAAELTLRPHCLRAVRRRQRTAQECADPGSGRRSPDYFDVTVWGAQGEKYSKGP